MENLDIVLSLSNLLKTNKGFFKSEKQAAFILSNVCDNEVVNHFTTYKNIARDHYHLDGEGVYKIERYTTKKGYVTTWERGQVHSLESAKNRDEIIKQTIQEKQMQIFGYTIDSKDFYSFIDLFNELNTPRNKVKALLSFGDDTEALLKYSKQVDEYIKAVQDFKDKYFSCTP